MFRTSIVPSSGAFLCCMLQFGMSRYVLLLWGWRKNCSSSVTLITYRNIPNCNIQHKNAPEDGLLKSETCWNMLWIKLIIKYCVSCWITDILQNDTRSIKYQIALIVRENCKRDIIWKKSERSVLLIASNFRMINRNRNIKHSFFNFSNAGNNKAI